MSEHFFKVLDKFNESPYQYATWPLPTKKDGTVVPSEWFEAHKGYPLEKCRWGLHAANEFSVLHWFGKSSNNLYELEFDKDAGFLDDFENKYDAKPVGYKARLVRKLEVTQDILRTLYVETAKFYLAQVTTKRHAKFVSIVLAALESGNLDTLGKVYIKLCDFDDQSASHKHWEIVDKLKDLFGQLSSHTIKTIYSCVYELPQANTLFTRLVLEHNT